MAGGSFAAPPATVTIVIIAIYQRGVPFRRHFNAGEIIKNGEINVMSKVKKELKSYEKMQDKLELARAQKLGLTYPLTLSERQKWEDEKYADKRLAEVHEIFTKSAKLNTQSKSDSSKLKLQKPPCVPWLHNVSPGLIRKPLTDDIECAVKSIEKRTMNKECDDIIFDLSIGLPGYYGFDKKLHKRRSERGYERLAPRVVIRVQFSPDCERALYIGENDLYSLMFYIGRDERGQKRGLLFYKCEFDNVYYVEPEEICIFYIVNDSKTKAEGFLTLFRKQDKLFIDKVVKGDPVEMTDVAASPAT